MADSTSKEISDSGNSNRYKPKKTSFQIQQVINEIGKMLSAGKPDCEIMGQLQIKRSQYYDVLRIGVVQQLNAMGTVIA